MRAGGIEGVVLIQAIIGTDGTIVDPRIISGHPELSTAALDAVKQWCYRPTLLNGMPVDAVTIITINFSLSD
jgi:protein TonB